MLVKNNFEVAFQVMLSKHVPIYMFNISFKDFKSPFYIHSSIVLGFKDKPSLIYRTTFVKIWEPKVPKDDLR